MPETSHTKILEGQCVTYVHVRTCVVSVCELVSLQL